MKIELKGGVVTSITDNSVKEVKDNFMRNNMDLKDITLDNVETIGDFFVSINDSLNSVTFPQVKKIGKTFLRGIGKWKSLLSLI